jgi:amino acid transporter
MGLAIVAMWFCGLSSVTSASRMLFAFARDEGLPMAHAIRRVSPKLKTPYVAILTVSTTSLALVAVTVPFSEAVFLVVASLATTGLYVSYALPITLGLVARHRGRWTRRGPWNLGRFGVAIGWVAVLWSAFVLVVCALPPNTLSGVLLAAVVVVLGLVYFGVVRGKFHGPQRDLESLQREPAARAA